MNATVELRRRAALLAAITGRDYGDCLLSMAEKYPELVQAETVHDEPHLELIQGAKKGTRMPKLMAIERFDQALQAALRISPRTPIDELKREILNRDKLLYEELRAESSAQDFASRQAFLEAQRRCAIIGKGVHAIALAGAQEVLGYEGARDKSQVHATPAPGTRTMEEIHRMVAEAKKRSPNLDDVAARKQVFVQRPDLYHAYRRETTRHTRRSQ